MMCFHQNEMIAVFQFVQPMKKIAGEGRGVLVVIRQSEDNKSLVGLIHRYQLEDNGVLGTANAPDAADWRMTGAGARILADLGVHKLKVLGTEKSMLGYPGLIWKCPSMSAEIFIENVFSENRIL